MYGGQHWFGGGFMWIFWLVLIIAIIWGAKVFSSSESNRSGQEKSALKILKDRYARGEIDQEEYVTKKKDLTG